jgi:hypothetical protein
MMFIILVFALFLTSPLAAYYPPHPQYQPPANQPPPPTGYVLVPQDRLEEVFTPKEEGPSLKDLATAALAGKIELLKLRADVVSGLKDYKRAKQELKESENMLKALQKLIEDRTKAKDAQAEKLNVSIKTTKEKIKTAQDAVKKIREGKKTAEKPADANEAERTAVGIDDVIASTQESVNQATAEIAQDNPEVK